MDWFASFVVDVNTDISVLKKFIKSLSKEIPRGAEFIFLCSRTQRKHIEYLLELGQIVMVKKETTSLSEAFNHGIALSTGDPIVLLSSEYIMPENFFGEILSIFQQNRAAAAAIIDEHYSSEGLGDYPFGSFAFPRKTLDTIGYLRENEDIFLSFMDYQARLKVAGSETSILQNMFSKRLDEVSTKQPQLTLEGVKEKFNQILKGYEKGKNPLFVKRCFYRDHIKKEPIKLISFVFVTYNRLDFLKQTWENLFEVTPEISDLNCEFIFVDNGSREDVKEWLLLQDALVVFNPANLGIAPARNQALALSRGDPVVMIDPDILLPKGWFQKALEILSLPAIGFTGVSEEEQTYQVLKIEGVDVEIKQGNIAGVWVIPRQTLDLLGFFNEEYLFYGGEDSDYGTRIILAGLFNTYVPHMKGIHLGAKDGVYSGTKSDYVQMKAKWWDLNMSLCKKRAEEYAQGKRSLRVERVKYYLEG